MPNPPNPQPQGGPTPGTSLGSLGTYSGNDQTPYLPSQNSPTSAAWQNASPGVGGGISTAPGVGNNLAVGDSRAPISYGQLAGLYTDPNAAAENAAIQKGMGMQMPNAVAGITQLGAVNNANAAQINQAQSNALLGGQVANINQLNAMAHGQGPSVAAMQAQQQANQNIAAQMAMMGSQRGASNSALGLRAAQDQAAVANQQAMQAGVMGRTQEEMGAQQQLGQMLGQTQGQVMQGAQAQAQLQQQANLQNSQAANQATLQQGQMNQQTALANLQAQLQSGQINMAQYNAMLQAQLGVDQNQYAAAQNFGNLVTGENTQLQGIQAGVGINSSNNAVGETGAAVGALGTVGAAGLQAASDRRLKRDVKPAARSIKDFLSQLSAPSHGFALLEAP